MGLAGMASILIGGLILRFQYYDPSLPGMERSEFKYRMALIDGQLFLHGVAGKLGLDLGVWAWKKFKG